jgi:hypothetical protein
LVRYYGAYSKASRGKRKKERPAANEEASRTPAVIEAPPPPVSKELKRRWSYFIRKVYETDPLVCPKCAGEMGIISFVDELAVIKNILQHLGLWEECHARPAGVLLYLIKPAKTQFISSLIAFERANIAQSQAQRGSELI